MTTLGPSARTLIVSIDTEVDKDPEWRVSAPVSFRSVVEGVPRVFTPLFAEFGVRPTYLLSPEVIDDAACRHALDDAAARGAELGVHLHPEFIEPELSRVASTMAGLRADGVLSQYTPDVERAKLREASAEFTRHFGSRPRSFRAGRFGLSPHTLRFLAEEGYTVDSSVTPGVRWDYAEGVFDYRAEHRTATVVSTEGGPIVEAPVTILPGSLIGGALSRSPLAAVGAKLLGRRGRMVWLRPSFSSAEDMIWLADRVTTGPLVMMLHSMEIIPGASPYARTRRDADVIVERMRRFFAHCARQSIAFSVLSSLAEERAD